MKNSRSLFLVGSVLISGACADAWELPVGNQKVDFHGFASQGYLASTDYNYLGATTGGGSFAFSEFAINASIAPFKRTRITAQAVSFDLGDIGNYDPLLDYASIEYTFADWLGVRAGRVRTSRGIYNHIQDIDVARTSVLLPQGIYDGRWRDFSASLDGGVVFGSRSLGKAGMLSYEAYAGMANISDDGGVAQQIRNSLPPEPIGEFNGIDNTYAVGSQIWWAPPVNGLRFGVAAGYVPNLGIDQTIQPPFGPGAVHVDATVTFQQFSVEYLWKSWTFQAEYYRFANKQVTSVGGNKVDNHTNVGDAWYVGAAYRVNKWLETGTYYSEHYANDGDRGGEDIAVSSDAYQKDLALSLRFDLTEWWIFKLEGHYIRGTAELYDNARNPERNEDGWWLLAAKATFSF